MTAEENSLFWPLVISAAGAIVIAALGGLLTDIGPWYKNLKNPSWKPPDWAFGPIWTVILTLAAIAAAFAWNAAPHGAARMWMVGAWLVNAILHVMWSGLFFRWRRPDWALVEVLILWLSIVLLIAVIGRYSTAAALLLAPYLAWVAIAAFLNFEVVRLNGPFNQESRR
jgi:translocator protein